jgi:hypothetical protein
MVATTRATSVANAISAMPSSAYRLDVLAFEVGMDLMKRIVPEALDAWPQETADLVRSLEGLPLAIRVAGHLLKAEMSYGLDIHDLVAEIKEASKILESKAPADRLDAQSGTIPSVAALLEKSTARLDKATRRCFPCLVRSRLSRPSLTWASWARFGRPTTPDLRSSVWLIWVC